jgi:hypothetical protein
MDVLNPWANAHGWIKSGAGLGYKRLPWALIRLGGLFVPTWASLAEMRYLWDTPHALANDKLTALIGAEPHTALADAAIAAMEGLD